MYNYKISLIGSAIMATLGIGMVLHANVQLKGADTLILAAFLMALGLLLKVVFSLDGVITDMSRAAIEIQPRTFTRITSSNEEFSQLEARVANLERLIDIDKTDDELLKQKVCTLSNLKYYVEKMQKTYITRQEANKRYKQKNNLEQLLEKNK